MIESIIIKSSMFLFQYLDNVSQLLLNLDKYPIRSSLSYLNY